MLAPVGGSWTLCPLQLISALTLSTMPSRSHQQYENHLHLCLQALDRWEERLEALFEGRPYDELDATLTDTLSQFPVDIQPFRWAGVLLQDIDV